MNMARKRSISLIAAFGVLALSAFAQVRTSIPDILKNPDEFDGKAVIVVGVVDKYEEKKSARGNPYTVFRATADGKTLNVYMTGHPKEPNRPKDKDKVELTGIYTKERKVGDVSFRDEIDVTEVKGKPYGIKILERAKL